MCNFLKITPYYSGFRLSCKVPHASVWVETHIVFLEFQLDRQQMELFM